ncbi:hypothetical protein HPB48_019268 [Haemaphysalis longicornis]|uniref:CRAL-TRIO domain-containing protein n=1 Tax=Haemaphysalis longicornis TaxID=44386 RepID=A0A9J6GDS7_HAELO|nr:hypothetical protein HPB48_019268 [Haemaphysalis longicornis]
MYRRIAATAGRARKYNVERAFDSIKKYFMFRRDMPEINEGLTPDSIPFDSACRKHGLFTVSRQKDPQGRAVYMINIGVWTKDVCSMNDFFKVCTLHLEQLILDEEAQIKGVVAILNLKGLGVEHLTEYTPSVIRKLFDIVQASSDHLSLKFGIALFAMASNSIEVLVFAARRVHLFRRQ